MCALTVMHAAELLYICFTNICHVCFHAFARQSHRCRFYFLSGGRAVPKLTSSSDTHKIHTGRIVSSSSRWIYIAYESRYDTFRQTTTVYLLITPYAVGSLMQAHLGLVTREQIFFWIGDAVLHVHLTRTMFPVSTSASHRSAASSRTASTRLSVFDFVVGFLPCFQTRPPDG